MLKLVALDVVDALDVLAVISPILNIEAHAMGEAAEELYADEALQRLDPVRYRRWRHSQLPRRNDEAPMTGGRLEEPQRLQRGKLSHRHWRPGCRNTAACHAGWRSPARTGVPR